MADKKITDLQLRSNVDVDVNFPVDDGIQSYRVTSVQLKAFILAAGNITRSMLAAGAMSGDLKAKTATYAIALTDDVLRYDSTGGAFTTTLPTAIGCSGKIFVLKKLDASVNAVTIATTSSQTIDGLTSRKMKTIGEAWAVISDGANWQVMHHYASTPWFNATADITSSGAAKGTTSVDEFRWRRHGCDMELMWTYIQTGSGTTGTGNMLLLVPNSEVIDSAQIKLGTSAPSGQWIGNGGWNNSAVTPGALVMIANDTTHLAFYAQGSNYYLGSGGAGFGSSADFILTMRCKFPIVDWAP